MSFHRNKKRHYSKAAESRAARNGAGGRRRRRRAVKTVGLRRRRLCAVSFPEDAAVAERLAVLKELVPSMTPVGWRTEAAGRGCNKTTPSTGADRLFEDAAGYIILLKARVNALQSLLQVYNNSGDEEGDP